MAKPKSTLGALVPFIITFVLLAIAGAIGYVVYSIAMDVADKTGKKMEKKNLSFSKDGMKVGVKEISAEQIGDSTQKVLMKSLTTQDRPFQLRTSLSSGGSAASSPASPPGAGTEKRRPFSRGSSSQAPKAK